jgi:hypothetical protein
MKMKCKEKDCGEEIDYEREPITAFRFETGTTIKSGTKTVYLTCGNGHTHAYRVPVEG